MRRNRGGKLMWGITVVFLLWFVEPIGAIPLESWDDKIPNAGNRFKVLSKFGNQAVLDKETQLVWEQAPDTTTMSWSSAAVYCLRKNVGGTVGWRLPSVVELKSVQDLTLPGHFVPASVFTGIQTFVYWSATTVSASPTSAWGVFFNDGDVNIFGKVLTAHVWCVRGGMGADQY